MEHPAFEEAGSNSGIEIWTIDKFEPVAIENQMYGKFYNGDSYIVLKTTGDDVLTYDAHFWLGAKTTQDKMGSAAILTVTLDDMLGGRAVHHREVQGHESSKFLGYFKPAVRYLEGGNESGFNQVEINAGAEKRLLRLSGCDNMRIEQVPPEASSLNRDQCFILEVEHDIFVLIPEGARATHRRKIIDVANKLRDEDHNGRASIEIIDEFSSDEDLNTFFEALGSGSKDELEEDQSTDSYSRASPSEVYLYRVLLGDELELVAVGKPFRQNSLASGEVYILDTPCSGVYVWLGKDVDPEVRKNYNDIVQKYFDTQGYPNWVNVTRVSEGAECPNFKQYFHKWDSIATSFYMSDTDAGYFSSDADESAAAAYKIGKSAAARGYMPDHGEGDLAVTRIAAGDAEDMTELVTSGFCILFESQVYVVKYKYTDENGDEGYVVYIWVGKQSTPEDKETALKLAAEIDDEVGGATVVQVPQGKEPKHFLSIFKGRLLILFGGKDNEYKADNSTGDYEDSKIRLFKVAGIEAGVDMCVRQMEESAEVLTDSDVYILETPEVFYVWNGKESNASERESAMELTKFVAEVVGDKEVVEVMQGDDNEELIWSVLGIPSRSEDDDNSGWKSAVSRRVTTPPSLYAVTVTVTGKIRFEELSPDFTQEDLSDDGLYILDVGEELYFWEGANIKERVKMARVEIIEEYIKDDGLERTPDTTLVVGVKQGKEPTVFRKLFPSWDDDMWQNQVSYEDIKNETKGKNSK